MKQFKILSPSAALLGALFLCGPTTMAQESAAKSADEIAQELANPNTPLASLNFKNQFRWFDGTLPGSSSEFGYTLLFQPSLPFPLANGDSILFRPAIPLVVDQPIFNPTKGSFDSENGLGDIVFDLAYARTSDTGLLTAFGFVSTIPTASSSELSGGQWAIGPEVLIGKLTKDYVLGIFPNHQWDVAGWTDKNVNVSSCQLFATFLPGGGWNFGTNPIISYDWNNEQWTIPINVNVGKTVMIGGKPWKLSAEANYYVEKSDTFGAEWMIGLNVAPVVENVFAKWFK
jgi:hypothetical protein